MVSITEIFFLLIGISANFLLIFNLVIRPVLWSTTNTFLGCLLCINFLYILVELCILIDTNELSDQFIDEGLIQVLDHVFSDYYKSILCSARYLAGFIFLFSSLVIILGTIFIRMIMIKHAENIRTNRFIRKGHQAYLKIFGILVRVWLVTLITNAIINFSSFSSFSF